VTLSSLRHRVEYAIVLALRALVSVLPATVCDWLGGGIGFTLYVVDAGHRRLATRQLRHAFPIRSERECRAIARATFIHFGRALISVLRASTRTAAQIAASVDVEGAEHVRAALAGGKGLIIVTAHFGYWEL